MLVQPNLAWQSSRISDSSQQADDEIRLSAIALPSAGLAGGSDGSVRRTAGRVGPSSWTSWELTGTKTSSVLELQLVNKKGSTIIFVGMQEDFFSYIYIYKALFAKLFFFSFFISRFWWNLTPKNRKFNQICTLKTKFCKIFPISLLKNSEILPGKKKPHRCQIQSIFIILT